MSEEQKPQEQATAQQDGAQPESFDLTLQDLTALKTIIDVAAQRGSFKPSEMAAVGTVYNKLSGFLDAVAKQNAPKEQQG
jgi:hypothetical protein